MGVPTTGNSIAGGSSLAMTNQPWIWRWVSREIKRHRMKEKMRGRVAVCGRRRRRKKMEKEKNLGAGVCGSSEKKK